MSGERHIRIKLNANITIVIIDEESEFKLSNWWCMCSR